MLRPEVFFLATVNRRSLPYVFWDLNCLCWALGVLQNALFLVGFRNGIGADKLLDSKEKRIESREND